jgi:hypothetical protein
MKLAHGRPTATCRNTTAGPCRSGAFRDPSPQSCSFASGALGLRARRGGAGSRDQGDIDDPDLLHRNADSHEMGYGHFKVLIAYIVLLQQVEEHEKRGLVRDPIADHGDLRIGVSTAF